MTNPASLGNRFSAAVWEFAGKQRILMVTDGLHFGDGNFGLSEFVGIVVAAGHDVHTAHRHGSGDGMTIPGKFDFSTADPPVTTQNYDQLWLFGVTGDAELPVAEQRVIARFMQDGGGVFATGDHEKLGWTLGAHIPRVRKMRDWSSVPMGGKARLDTVMDAGSDGIDQFEDQSDAIAQRIFPVYFSNGGSCDLASTWSVHPVLQHPSGAVDCLPDHPHESECLAPEPDCSRYAEMDEWPAPKAGGPRIAPVLVAKSISAGRFRVGNNRNSKPPVMPRCFGAISAYDGHPAGVGRIVCDATWHHFINVNLNGKDALPDAKGAERIGLYVRRSDGSKVPTPEYLKIQTYYHNTIRWLAPPGPRGPLMFAAVARFDIAALELRLPRDAPDWSQLLEIGRELQDVIDRRFGPGALTTVVDDMLSALGEGSGLAELLHSRAALKARECSSVEPLLPLADMRRVVFASLVNVLAGSLPADEGRLESLMKDRDALALDAMEQALLDAEAAIRTYLCCALNQAFGRFELLGKQPLNASLPSARKRLGTAAVAATAAKKQVRPAAKKTGPAGRGK